MVRSCAVSRDLPHHSRIIDIRLHQSTDGSCSRCTNSYRSASVTSPPGSAVIDELQAGRARGDLLHHDGGTRQLFTSADVQM